MSDASYSMRIGNADSERLRLLGRFYDPALAAFLESAGVGAGDTVVDVGCGHGGVTARIAARVGRSGVVYAVDPSAEQLEVARTTLSRMDNVTYVRAALEDNPLQGRRADWVYSRFLLMHVPDLRRALRAMADMLVDGGALLLEIADVGSLRFSPADPDSDLWRPWWYSLGRTRGLSFDVVDRIDECLQDVGFAVHRRDRHQPVDTGRDAKLLTALGFEQCAPAYLTEVGATTEQVQTHRAYLDRVLDDRDVTVALFENTQFVARRRT